MLAELAILALSSFSAPATDVAVSLHRASLDAEALAAAGVSSAQVAAVIAAAEDSDALSLGNLATADAAYDTAIAEVNELRRTVRSSDRTEQDIADLATAKESLLIAKATVEAALTDLFDVAIAGLSAPTKETLATIRGNRSHKAPLEFLAVDRTDAQWLQLRRLLDHEHVCDKTGEEHDHDCETELASIRAASAVASAKASLDANLASVTAAWNSAVAD